MLFEIDNVELYFKGKSILNGIYLKAETGKITGLLGSNGSGKTCLLSIVFGHLKPKYQLIRIDGKACLKPLFKQHIAAYLPQHHLVPNQLKIKMAFKVFAVDFNQFLERFEGFKPLSKSKFKHLSGGERRLIETYLILKTTSKLVLLDEPFTHLSPIFIEDVKQLISEEKKHKAIILTDHLFRNVVELSDDMYLLKNGSTTPITDVKALEDYGYISIDAF